MKKYIATVLSLIMLFTVFIACSKNVPDTSVISNDTEISNQNNESSISESSSENNNSQTQEETVTEQIEDDKSENDTIPTIDRPANVAALIGPTGIGLTYLTSYSNFFNLELFTAPDQVTAKIINGEVDIAAVPVNLASVLYNKTKGAISVIAVNTLGVLYIVERGDSIHSIQDLAGKTIYATGQGSTPQYILEQVLANNNLTDSVTVEYIADGTELASKLVKGDIEIGLLPEPQVSVACIQSQNEVRVALSMNDLWNEKNSTSIVQGVYIVRNEYLKENPWIVSKFMEDAAASADKVVKDENAPADVVAAGILPKEPIAKRAIPNCNICFISGEEMKTIISAMLETLYNLNPSSVGGKLPDENFYYWKN